MTKIFSSDMHGNDNASISFNAAVLSAMSGVCQMVRSRIDDLSKSRKADEWVPGSIHALRMLCEGGFDKDRYCDHYLVREEVEEWQETFFAWFDRVKRHYPDEYRDQFLANAEDDFRVILECSSNPGLSPGWWRKSAAERFIKIKFESPEALQAARRAADEKHPVDLGSALFTYLDNCIAQLIDEPVDENKAAETDRPAEKQPDFDMLSPRMMWDEDGNVWMYLNSFDCFDTPEDLEQDIVTSAYDVEEALQNYLKEHHVKSLKQLKFDSESSMFCVSSKRPEALSLVTEVLLRFATDRELYLQYHRD